MDGQSPKDMKIWEMQDDDIHRIQYEERHYKFGIGHDLDPSALSFWPRRSTFEFGPLQVLRRYVADSIPSQGYERGNGFRRRRNATRRAV